MLADSTAAVTASDSARADSVAIAADPKETVAIGVDFEVTCHVCPRSEPFRTTVAESTVATDSVAADSKETVAIGVGFEVTCHVCPCSEPFRTTVVESTVASDSVAVAADPKVVAVGVGFDY